MGGVGDGLVEGGVDFDPFTDPDARPLVEVESRFGARRVDKSGDFAGGESGGAGEADVEHRVLGAIAFHRVEHFEGVGEPCGEGRIHFFVNPVTDRLGDFGGVRAIPDDFTGLVDEFGVVALDEGRGLEPFLHAGFGDGDFGDVEAFERDLFPDEGVGIAVAGIGLAFVVEQEVVGERPANAQGEGLAGAGLFDGFVDVSRVGNDRVVGVGNVLGDFFGLQAHGHDARELFLERGAVAGHVGDAFDAHGGDDGFGFEDLGEYAVEYFFFLADDGDGAFDFLAVHGFKDGEGGRVADFHAVGDERDDAFHVLKGFAGFG